MSSVLTRPVGRHARGGYNFFEILLVCGIIAPLVLSGLSAAERTIHAARVVALRAGLRELRMAINLYRALNQNKVPRDLRQLVDERFATTIRGAFFKGRYLVGFALDEQGHPVDPFGNRYMYNSQTGEVWSNTRGYEAW